MMVDECKRKEMQETSSEITLINFFFPLIISSFLITFSNFVFAAARFYNAVEEDEEDW